MQIMHRLSWLNIEKLIKRGNRKKATACKKQKENIEEQIVAYSAEYKCRLLFLLNLIFNLCVKG